MVFSDDDDVDLGTGSTPGSTSNTPKESNSLPVSESPSNENGPGLSSTSKTTPTSKSQKSKRKLPEKSPNPAKRPSTSTLTEKKESEFTSDVWDYFRREIIKGKEEDGMRAICRFCGMDYLISGTGNMRNHLKNKHPQELPETTLQDKNEKLKQTTLDKNLMVMKPYKVFKILKSLRF